MQKFFVEENQINDDKITIIGEDVKHISNVLRMKKGDKIQIGNKKTQENYIAQIENISKESVVVSITKKIEFKRESNVQIDIYQGLPKADKMELIIQKTTEIGVVKILPVEMERSIVKLNEKDAKKKIERWQKIAEVAAKQSKRDIIPIIENVQNIEQVCNKIKEYDCFIVAYEDEKKLNIKQVLKKIKKEDILKIGLLVGPEGGIDLKEVNRLKENGAKITSLGSRILRTETAPIVASSIILYELEN